MSESARPTKDECAVDYVAEQYSTRSLAPRRRKPRVIQAECQRTAGDIHCAGIARVTTGEVKVASDTRLVPCIARFMQQLGEVTTDQPLDQSLLSTPDQIASDGVEL